MVAFDLPEKVDGAEGLLPVHESVLRATAIGSIVPEDAKDISSMLETHRRLVDRVDLEQRIARLEAEQVKT